MAPDAAPTQVAPLQFTVTRTINATAAQAFDALISESGMRAWIPLCRSATWRHPAGVTQPGVGSVRDIVLPGGINAAERIVGWEAGRELRYTFGETSLPLNKVTKQYLGITRIESLGGAQSSLCWSVHFEMQEGREWMRPMLRAGLRFFVGLMASRLKREAERRGQ